MCNLGIFPKDTETMNIIIPWKITILLKLKSLTKTKHVHIVILLLGIKDYKDKAYMEPKKLSMEERIEYVEFQMNVIKLLKSEDDVSPELIRETRNKIASILKSDAFTKGEKDELADMCILLHKSLG